MKRTLLFLLAFSQCTTVLVAQFQKNGYSESWVPKTYDYYNFNSSDSIFYDPIKFDVTYHKARVHTLVEFDENDNPIERLVFTYDSNGTITEEEFSLEVNGIEQAQIKEVYRDIWFADLPYQQFYKFFYKEWKKDSASDSLLLRRNDTAIFYPENGRFQAVEFYGLQMPTINRVLKGRKWIKWDGNRGELIGVSYLFNGDSTLSHRYDVIKDQNGKIKDLVFLGTGMEYYFHIDSWFNEELLLIKDFRVDTIGPGNVFLPYSRTYINSENNLFIDQKEYRWNGQEYVLDWFENKTLNFETKDLISFRFEIPGIGHRTHDTLITTIDSEGRVLEELFLSSVNGSHYVPDWKKVYSGHVSSQKELNQDFKLQIFPNPCSEIIHFEKTPGPWLLINSQGQSVFQSHGGKLEEKIKQVPPGNYFLVFTGTGLSQQLIVE
ncbi:MAG: hypothetical protein ACI9YL_000947 [Luteibaculaceae bacterium]|jgi:hypothetical protein